MSQLKKQINLFLTALGFFTRIPCRYHYSQESINRSNRYFPLVGIIVGSSAAGIFELTGCFMPKSIAILFSMVTTILITGAFHEDGFADVCDGFGGGWNKERILLIMKDSRIGAYGVIGIIMLLLLKYVTLSEMSNAWIVPAMIVGHTLSRSMASWTMYSLNYVRDDETSKSKPIAESIRHSDFTIAIITGLASLLLFRSWLIFLMLLPLFIFKYFIERWFVKWLGGYTGDCLGAIQQISEIIFYLSILIIDHNSGSTFYFQL